MDSVDIPKDSLGGLFDLLDILGNGGATGNLQLFQALLDEREVLVEHREEVPEVMRHNAHHRTGGEQPLVGVSGGLGSTG